METTIRGHLVRVAQGPEELLVACHGNLSTPDHGDAIDSLLSMWNNGTGIVLEGGACFLEDLGDGVWGMTLGTSPECQDRAAACTSSIDFAFIATDCMRLVTSAVGEAAMQGLQAHGLSVFNRTEVTVGDGAETVFHMGIDLDTWVCEFGPRLFYVEASRLGNSEKAARTLERWARYYADPSVLNPDESEGLQGNELRDWFADEFTKRRDIAAPHFGEEEIASWTLEHTPDCPHQLLRLDCPCGLYMVFLSSRQVVLVGQHGDVQTATLQ